VGLCLVEEYEGAHVTDANGAIFHFVAQHAMATVPIDTRLDVNGTGLRSPAEVESLISKMDVLITTRLHGMVLALKNGVPVVAIDPEPGGAKIRRQAEAIGWPAALSIDALNETNFEESFQYCLSNAARSKASDCGRRAADSVRRIRAVFLQTLGGRDVPANTLRAGNRISPADPVPVTPILGPAPVSRIWGYDRGLPIDRHYIEGFLERHSADIGGRVLEVGDDAYTRRFAGHEVVSSDVLHVSNGNPRATIVADLTHAEHIPGERFDCIILTQTLHLIYDLRCAIAALKRILRPGGVLLATLPGITRISQVEWPGSWFWSLTDASARRLFEEAFDEGNVTIESHGNVLAAAAFLYGLAVQDVGAAELDPHDPDYQVIIAVRAVKGSSEIT
jgi:SAM-dependent methyltransferase